MNLGVSVVILQAPGHSMTWQPAWVLERVWKAASNSAMTVPGIEEEERKNSEILTLELFTKVPSVRIVWHITYPYKTSL